MLRGYVYNSENQILPGASIRVYNLLTGTQTNAEGQYELKLEQGLHRISASYLGYISESVEIVISENQTHNFFLKPDQKLLSEVVIKNKKHDFSYEIIRNVIENKEKWQNQYQNLSCLTYVKSSEEIQNAKPPKKEEENDPFRNDSIPKLNYFEASIQRYEAAPDKLKEERTAVKKTGDIRNLFYTSLSDGTFDLYQNLQTIKKLGQNAFVSPFSTVGYISYKFSLLGSYYNGERLIYRIEVKPKDLGNALYEGEVEVEDGIWAIKKVDLKVPKKLLIEYGSFSFQQEYETVENRRIITKEHFEWKTKEGSITYTGNAKILHKNFVFDSTYAKNFFGPEIGLTTKDAYKKNSSFWETIRPIPLLESERVFLKAKELEEIRLNSKEYLDSIDAVYNKITFLKIAWQGVGHINRAKKNNWEFGSLPSLINPLAIGGWRVQYKLGYYKRYENRQYIRITPYLNYGFTNKDLLGNLSGTYYYNPIRQSSLSFNIGQGFDVINGQATIADLARRNNFYINTGAGLSHRTELFNGFYLNSEVRFNKREDFGDFQFSKLGDEIFQNNSAIKFPTSKIVKFNFRIDYTPKQQYLSEPNEKIVLGSKFPTFSWRLSQAFQGTDGLKKAFTYTEFNIAQSFNVGILGTSQYRMGIGKFLDTTRLAPMDYQYQRGGDRWWLSPNMYTYQLIPKTFSTFNWFFESHYEHQFNGFLTSKIPLLNKTGIREVAGAGILYVPEKNYQYNELYMGLNRVFKMGKTRFRIGTYYVISQSNKDGFRSGFKFSFEPYNRDKNTWSF